MTVTVKRGDRYPTTWTAVGMDLTGCTVRLLARHGATTRVLVSTVTDPAAGVVTHVLDGTLDAGVWMVELEVTAGDEIVTFPTSGHETLIVVADLG